MKLLVGLGNIGAKYEKTRHNIGFEVIDALAEKYGLDPWKSEKKFFGSIRRGQIGREKILFLKPETYMNLSGKAVSAVTSFYKLRPSDMWVFFDDVDLEFGTIRFREKGSSGGHNGIKSLIQGIGSDQFPRIKIGIANSDREKIPTDRFVLQKFSSEEKKQLPVIIDETIQKFLIHSHVDELS